jgi:hypothetical protein
VADRANVVTVGLYIEERMLSDALTTWFVRRSPAHVRGMPAAPPGLAVLLLSRSSTSGCLIQPQHHCAARAVRS